MIGFASYACYCTAAVLGFMGLFTTNLGTLLVLTTLSVAFCFLGWAMWLRHLAVLESSRRVFSSSPPGSDDPRPVKLSPRSVATRVPRPVSNDAGRGSFRRGRVG